MHTATALDTMDRNLINRLQDGLPVCDRPFAAVAAELGIGEVELLQRLARLREQNYLTRIGPLFNVERLGGAFTLAALQVPEDRFDAVADIVNGFPEVAHNYRREHRFNMWFVIAVEVAAELDAVIRAIETATGLPVYNFPKQTEFYLRLHFDV